ncbi:hypothetical protein [Streptomyces albus]|uniref:Lipoprotein n=1 Tax=Streptomyces albus TaxID=1888 RepID=A0A8H1L6T9_9ACTN|nr:hypothetical protein [Streptomyces albus]TGG77280.1 hypothetical protein D8771_27640 [Streptomyces albus]UVN56584.1 hypothetical protein NR995_20230 [Streptomyces albus]
MQLPRRAASLAAVAAASAVLLAGCGNDDGPSDGKIEGADSAKKTSAAPTPTKGEDAPKEERPDFRTSDITLPEDIKLVFDWKQPDDPEKAAALDGAADYMRAIKHGTVEQDPKDPVLARHVVPLQTAEQYATALVKADVDEGLTATGEERYYREQIGDVVDGKLAEVAFCVDQSDYFSKKVKSGKVLRTEESPSSYMRFTLVMQKPEKTGLPWKARTFEFEGKAVKKCKD